MRPCTKFHAIPSDDFCSTCKNAQAVVQAVWDLRGCVSQAHGGPELFSSIYLCALSALYYLEGVQLAADPDTGSAISPTAEAILSIQTSALTTNTYAVHSLTILGSIDDIYLSKHDTYLSHGPEIASELCFGRVMRRKLYFSICKLE